MVVMPAVAAGALAVFLVGYVATLAALEVMTSRKKDASKLSRGFLTEKGKDRISVVGGIIAVVLVVLLMVVGPRESAKKIWIGLTIVGVVFGLLTFLLHGPKTKSQTRVRYRPRASTRVPPHASEYHYRPAASASEPSPTQEDPYRVLLAKAMYDQDLADRLIERERKHMPYASLDDLCRSAIARLERDNW